MTRFGGVERTIGGLAGSRTFGIGSSRSGSSSLADRPPLTQQGAQFRRVLGYLRPYWKPWLAILSCVLSGVALGVLPPQIVRTIVDVALPQGSGRLLNWLALAMVTLPIITGLISVLQQYLTTKVGQAVMFDLHNHLYTHLQQLGLRFFVGRRTGEVMSRVNNDVSGVNSVLTNTMISVVTNSITVTMTLVVMLAMNWRLALLAITVLPIFIFPTQRVGGIRRRITRQASEKQADLSAFMQETLNVSGYLLVKLFGRDRYEAERFRQKNLAVMALQIRQHMVGRWLFMVLGAVGAAGPALVYWYGGHQVILNNLTTGTIIAFVAYLGQLYRPMMQL